MSISGMGYVRPVYAGGVTVGTQLTTTATVSTASLPSAANGSTARWCLFAAVNTPTHVRVGGTTCTVNDLLVGTTPIALRTFGASQVAICPDNATAGAKINISPLEDA